MSALSELYRGYLIIVSLPLGFRCANAANLQESEHMPLWREVTVLGAAQHIKLLIKLAEFLDKLLNPHVPYLLFAEDRNFPERA